MHKRKSCRRATELTTNCVSIINYGESLWFHPFHIHEPNGTRCNIDAQIRRSKHQSDWGCMQTALDLTFTLNSTASFPAHWTDLNFAFCLCLIPALGPLLERAADAVHNLKIFIFLLKNARLLVLQQFPSSTCCNVKKAVFFFNPLQRYIPCTTGEVKSGLVCKRSALFCLSDQLAC